MRELLRPFGKYFLLDQLSGGGMADILRALGPEENGRRRVVILKRIQKTHSEREDFHQMFWSEIALTMRFRHPNIVRLFDFGEEAGEPFLAMEYIQGVSLRALVSKFHEQHRGFPVEFSLWAMAETAAGLYYAHEFKDSLTDQALHLVHRDISPHNVLVSFDGDVKVIDFGISKANVLEETTQAGMLKGKPCYMAPEYVHGGEIDHRFDIFAMGVVLWEMLSGKRLFLAENDFATLKMVRDCDKVVRPPSEVNPKLPKSVDAVVLKALAKNPDHRYQTADEFRKAVLGVLQSISPLFRSDQFRMAIREVFDAQITRETSDLNALVERAAIARISSIPQKPILDLVSKASAPAESHSVTLPTAPSLLFPNGAQNARSERAQANPYSRSGTQHTRPPTYLAPEAGLDSHRPWGWIATTFALSAALIWNTQGQWQPVANEWIAQLNRQIYGVPVQRQIASGAIQKSATPNQASQPTSVPPSVSPGAATVSHVLPTHSVSGQGASHPAKMAHEVQSNPSIQSSSKASSSKRAGATTGPSSSSSSRVPASKRPGAPAAEKPVQLKPKAEGRKAFHAIPEGKSGKLQDDL